MDENRKQTVSIIGRLVSTASLFLHSPLLVNLFLQIVPFSIKLVPVLKRAVLLFVEVIQLLLDAIVRVISGFRFWVIERCFDFVNLFPVGVNGFLLRREGFDRFPTFA